MKTFYTPNNAGALSAAGDYVTKHRQWPPSSGHFWDYGKWAEFIRACGFEVWPEADAGRP